MTSEKPHLPVLRRDGHGSRRRLALLASTALASLALVVTFGAGTALAIKLHPAPAESFGSDGTAGTSFDRVSSMAFQQATRRLYVLDSTARKLYGFGVSTPGTHTPISGFSPYAFPEEEMPTRAAVAADNSSLASAGNVYFFSRPKNSFNRLFGLNSSGTPLPGWPLDSPLGENAIYTGLGVDPAGNIWVPDPGGEGHGVRKLSPAGVLQTPFDIGSPDLVAFDSNSDMYLSVREIGGTLAVFKYAAPGYSKRTLVFDDAPDAMVVDRATHDLYILARNLVSRYGSNGVLLEQFGASLAGSGRNLTAMAVDEASGDVYLSTDQSGPSGMVYRFSGLEFPAATTVGVANPTNTTVTLTGTVRPDGVALTSCSFEYVTAAAFAVSGFSDLSSGGSESCTPGAGSIPANSPTREVTANIAGLVAGTPYRFRLVAANVNGANPGAALSLQLGQPGLETVGSPQRTATSAHLEGRIHPHGLATSYYFEYGTQGPCDANPCASTSSRPAGSGELTRLVSEEVAGLTPGAAYHYRLVADNGNPDGLAVGGDMIVTTRKEDGSLSHGDFPGPPGSDRAWEQVNAPETGGNAVRGDAIVSENGERVVYGVAGGSPNSASGAGGQFLASRTAHGWQTSAIYPSREEAKAGTWAEPTGRSDLSEFLAQNYTLGGVKEDFTLWRLSPERPPRKVFGIEDSAWAGFSAVSDDSSRAIVLLQGSRDPAHPVGPGSENLYDVSDGTAKMIGLLPGDTVPACGVRKGSYGVPQLFDLRRSSHWVSADGDLAFFPSSGNSCGDPERLYVRDIDGESTELISTPPISGPECSAAFIKSTPGAAFFYTQGRLVAEDGQPTTCGSQDGDIYRYDTATSSLACVTCMGTGVSADIPPTSSPATIGTLIAVAEDGSRIYFRSPNRLLPGAASSGIYRLKVGDGDLAYVASIGGNIGDVGANDNAITPDGAVVTFRSANTSLNPLGGSNNGERPQFYRYDDRDRSLVCVSCPQDGSPASAAVPAGSFPSQQLGPNATPLSHRGDVYAFSTPTPLVPADQNSAKAGQEQRGGEDVYEWRDGRLLLVTDGITRWPVLGDSAAVPTVTGVSPGGRDLFFTAAIQYTPDAVDGYPRLYDARIGGGFDFPQPPQPCPLEVCQGTPRGAPDDPLPGSASFSAAGDPAPRFAHRKKMRNRAQKHRNRAQKHRKKKRQQKKASKHRAHHDRRTSR